MTYVNKVIGKVWATISFYRETGHLRFIGTNVLKIVFLYALVVVAVILVAKHVLNLNQIFQNIIDRFTDTQVLVLFFVSESLLGMIPPDLFMLWAEKFGEPLWMLTFLGVLSYVGGIVSYWLGIWISRQDRVKHYIETRLKNYIALTQKWGGAFLVIAALFPFSPYSMVALAVSMFRYPFSKLLLFGVSRIIRFILQGTALIQLLEMG